MLTTRTYHFSQDPSHEEFSRGKTLCLIQEAFWQIYLLKSYPDGPNSRQGEGEDLIVKVDLGSNQQLQLVSKEKRIKGKSYPAVVLGGQETQLPIVGDEHLIFLLAGGIECIERSNDQLFSLKEGDVLRVTRSNKKKEYLNLRIRGRAERNSFIWLVIHS